MIFILVLPFGGALAARLRHQLWQTWVIWGICSLLALSLLWIANNFHSAIIEVGLVSIAGFLGNELWASCRGFMSHPRVFGWIAAGLGLIFLAYNPGFFGLILMAGIILVAFRIMFRPLLKKAKK